MNEIKPPGDKSHLERLITAWSLSPDAPSASRARRLVGVSAFANVVSNVNAEHSGLIVIKGGASMEIRFGAKVRSTTDIDAATPSEIDATLEVLEKALNKGWGGFTGWLTSPSEIKVPGGIPPLPQRCAVKLSYKNKQFMTLPFELSFLDLETSSFNEVVSNSIDLAPVQLNQDNTVVVLGVEAQIAQKLHACSEVSEERVNDRFHDLYDIALLEPLTRKNLSKLKQACEHVFETRDKHVWPPKIKEWEHWPELWEQMDIPETERIDYQEARNLVTKLIEDASNSLD